MKKTLYLLGAITSTLVTSCSKQEDTPRNYYGVQPENNTTPKEAFYALFVGFLLSGILLVWFLKKLKNKK